MNSVNSSDWILIAGYVPNAGQKLERLEMKREHFKKLTAFLCTLQEKKSIIFAGDLNVAHQEIDLARPKTNHKTCGFTPEERQDFTNLMSDLDLVDSFRHFYPDQKDSFSYYGYRFDCYNKGIGWR